MTVFMVREWKEKHSFVGDPREKVVVTAPVKGVPTELDITAEMQAACESLLPPIVETMLDLLSRVEPEFQERVRNNIILSGGGGLIRGLPEALETALRSGRRREGALHGGSGVHRIRRRPGLATDAPEGDWEKLTA